MPRLEGASAGLSHVSLRGVRLEMEGGVLTAPLVEVDIPVVPALLGKGFHVGALAASGWTIDVTHPRRPGLPNERDDAHPQAR